MNRFLSDYPVILGYSVTNIEVKKTVATLKKPKPRSTYKVTLKKSALNASTSADTIEILATSIVDASGIGNADYSAIKTFQGKANTSNTVSEYSLLPLQTAVTEMKRASETFVTQKDGEFTSSGGNPSQSQETKQSSSATACTTTPLIPCVCHSQDLYRALSLLSDPYAPFVGKTVVVVGTGDSARTILEFLFRVNTAVAAYGEGTNNTGIVGRVFWCGRSVRRSRDEYKTSKGERPRYATLAAAFNLRNEKKEKVLVPVSARVEGVKISTDGSKVECTLEKSTASYGAARGAPRNCLSPYPGNWSSGLEDIPDKVLHNFRQLVRGESLKFVFSAFCFTHCFFFLFFFVFFL